MKYRFQKLYADLVAEDGTVCIVYMAETHLFGTIYPHAGLELYWPDGHHEVCRAECWKDAPPRMNRFYFDVPGGPFIYDFDVQHADWAPGTAPADGLDWSVRFARSQAEARWLGNPARPRLCGAGYADFVDLRRLPRSLGLQRLDWGRIHWPNQTTFLFNALRFRDGGAWQRMAWWSPNGFYASDHPFAFVEADGAMHLMLPDEVITLRPVRVLHEGPALNPTRFPHRLERLIARAAAGPVRETRWLSQAEGSPLTPSEPGWAIHERVFFGASAQETFAEHPEDKKSMIVW